MPEARRMRSGALIGVILALGAGACSDNGSPAAPTAPTAPIRIDGTWTVVRTLTDYDGWECVSESPPTLPPAGSSFTSGTFTQDGAAIDIVFEGGATASGSVSGNRVQFMVETNPVYLPDSRLPNSIGSVDNRITNGECGGNCEEEYVSSVYEATVTTDGNMMVDGTSIAVFRVHPFGQPCTRTLTYSFTATSEVS